MTDEASRPQPPEGGSDPTGAAAPTAHPTQPVAGPTEPEPTPAAPPADPTEPEPIPAAPPAGPAPPPATKRTGVPSPAFLVVAIVAVAATVAAVVFYGGKSSADDDKQAAREELATARSNLSDARAEIDALEDEVAVLEEDLGVSEEIGTILGGLVTTGQDAADNLFQCADLSRSFIIEFFETGVPDVIAAENADAACETADESYAAFVDALDELEPVSQ